MIQFADAAVGTAARNVIMDMVIRKKQDIIDWPLLSLY